MSDVMEPMIHEDRPGHESELEPKPAFTRSLAKNLVKKGVRVNGGGAWADLDSAQSVGWAAHGRHS